ncbi:MAG: glycosyltransferase family 4 protein [Candidatus Zixiibacteriota bacterium]|nr:MAG: glycosyltransferase family 4 protein [candidate division Zixibacteria bacterium]
MNILALNWNDLENPLAGGAEVHLEELLRRLVSYGHSVTLFCSGWPGCKQEEEIEGIRIIRRGRRMTFNLVAPFYLRRLARDNHYDILVEDINKIPFYTPLYLSLKTLVVIPHLFATTVFHEINPVVGSYIYLAERPVITVYRGRHFNVISESTADDIAARGVPRKDISVIHCGIDREVYAPDSAVSKYEDPTILYLGRIKKYKSIQHLLIAFRRVRQQLPTSRLMIVGAGDYLDNLKKLADSLGITEHVEFPGFVSREEKVDRLRRAHVSVLPSLKEGWGLTNIEANSVGTAVVAADSPGLRDSVRDGETGYLYEYGNTEMLAEKLLTLLQDQELRRRIENQAMAWAETFNWDTAARKFEQLIIDIEGGKM